MVQPVLQNACGIWNNARYTVEHVNACATLVHPIKRDTCHKCHVIIIEMIIILAESDMSPKKKVDNR